jgi:hypothetical protein
MPKKDQSRGCWRPIREGDDWTRRDHGRVALRIECSV